MKSGAATHHSEAANTGREGESANRSEAFGLTWRLGWSKVSVRPVAAGRCKPKASRRDQERHTSTHVDLNRCTTLVWSQARAAFKISPVLPASSFEQCHPHCMAHLPVSGQAVLIQQHFNNPSVETLLVNRYHQQQATSNIWRRGWSRVRCKKRDYNML